MQGTMAVHPGDAGASAAFEEAYKARVTQAYPPSKNGTTLYPFTRFFLVAKRPVIF